MCELRLQVLTLLHLERLGSLLDADQARAGGIFALRQIPRIVRRLLVDEASVAVLVAGFSRSVQPCHEIVRAALFPRGQTLQLHVCQQSRTPRL